MKCGLCWPFRMVKLGSPLGSKLAQSRPHNSFSGQMLPALNEPQQYEATSGPHERGGLFTRLIQSIVNANYDWSAGCNPTFDPSSGTSG
jgi:hypothetical protein